MRKALVLIALLATTMGLSVLFSGSSASACPYPSKNLPPDPSDPRNYTPGCSPFETTTTVESTTTTVPVITTIGGPADVTTTITETTTTIVEDTTTTSTTVAPIVSTLPRTGGEPKHYNSWLIAACMIIIVGASFTLVRRLTPARVK